MRLGALIRIVRGSRSREEFAGIIGCSYFTLRRWELGEVEPRSTAHIRLLIEQGVPEAAFGQVEAVAQ